MQSDPRGEKYLDSKLRPTENKHGSWEELRMETNGDTVDHLADRAWNSPLISSGRIYEDCISAIRPSRPTQEKNGVVEPR